MKTEIVCQRQWFKTGLDFYIIARDHDGMTSHVGQPVTMEATVEDGRPRVLQGPTFFLDFNACQSLMDAMYSAGIRPTETSHVNETLAASKAHIVDLQKVAFGLMNHVVASAENRKT